MFQRYLIQGTAAFGRKQSVALSLNKTLERQVLEKADTQSERASMGQLLPSITPRFGTSERLVLDARMPLQPDWF